MKKQDSSNDGRLTDLLERSRELECLFKVNSLLHHQNAEKFIRDNAEFDELFDQLVSIIIQAWSKPESIGLRIQIGNKSYCSPDFFETSCSHVTQIKNIFGVMGSMYINYKKEPAISEELKNIFTKEKMKLIESVSELISGFLQFRKIFNKLSGPLYKGVIH